MPHLTLPNTPETLTYAVVASFAIEIVIAIVLAARGDWLGVLLVLAIAGIGYWFLCRQLVAVVTAGDAVAASGTMLFLGALADIVTGHPYSGLLFLLAAIVAGCVFVLLRQGAVPAELRLGGVIAIGAPSRAAQLRMLEELRDAGLLTEGEFIAKRALLGF